MRRRRQSVCVTWRDLPDCERVDSGRGRLASRTPRSYWIVDTRDDLRVNCATTGNADHHTWILDHPVHPRASMEPTSNGLGAVTPCSSCGVTRVWASGHGGAVASKLTRMSGHRQPVPDELLHHAP